MYEKYYDLKSLINRLITYSSYDWCKLLIEYPEYIHYCNTSEIFQVHAKRIIVAHPTLAKYFDLSKITGKHLISEIIDRCPELDKYFPHNVKKRNQEIKRILKAAIKLKNRKGKKLICHCGICYEIEYIDHNIEELTSLINIAITYLNIKRYVKDDIYLDAPGIWTKKRKRFLDKLIILLQDKKFVNRLRLHGKFSLVN